MFENSAIDLFTAPVRLRADGTADPATPDERRAVLTGTDSGLWTLMAFHADDDRAVHADVWERHPNGSEVLCVLAGTLQVHLRDGSEPAVLTTGSAYVVPAGTWHRLSVVEPADLISITPRSGTQHERAEPVGARP
ncbi:cupin domain-containing protein [Pseudonocardia sp. CA-107938]|uniref:cupin domain-containing protein n=1 Tax=Pseudonocardia sp. CA-107938 TaxID=3240021 RepID=UPI003D91F723